MAETVTSATWSGELRSYAEWMTAAGTARTTLRIYMNYLERLADFTADRNPHLLTVDDLSAFLGSHRDWSPSTRKSARGALRSFCQWAHKTGRTTEDPSRLLRPVRVPAGLPRPCPDDVLERALSRAIARDRLMLMLAAYAGLRRAEIAQVHTRDVLGATLRVHGKGGKDRDVPLHPALVEAIAERPRGYLFPSDDDGHLSADRVGHIIRALLGGGWTAHTLRHRFLTRAYAVERDARAVQELAGHAKLDTTMVYTKVPDGALQRAVMGAGPAGVVIDLADAAKAPRRRNRVPRKPHPSPGPPSAPVDLASRRAMSDRRLAQAVRMAMAMAENSFTGVVLLMLVAGLTVDEVQALRRGDYVTGERALMIGGTGARMVRVTPDLAALLEVYTTRTDSQIGRQESSDFMFRFTDGTRIPASWIRDKVTKALAGGGCSDRDAVSRLAGLEVSPP